MSPAWKQARDTEHTPNPGPLRILWQELEKTSEALAKSTGSIGVVVFVLFLKFFSAVYFDRMHTHL